MDLVLRKILANLYCVSHKLICGHCWYKIVHSDLLNKTWNIHQQYDNVNSLNSHIGYHTIQCSKFTTVQNNKTIKIINKTIKTAGAVVQQLALKLQKRNNFPVCPFQYHLF